MTPAPLPETPTQPAAAQPITAQPVSAPVESKALSVTSLVLGIASLVFGYTFLVPVGAVVLGILALTREPSSRAMSIWGIVLGGLTLFGSAIAVIVGIALFVPLGLAGLLAI